MCWHIVVGKLLFLCLNAVDNKNKKFLVEIYGFFPQDEYSIKDKNYTGKFTCLTRLLR